MKTLSITIGLMLLMGCHTSDLLDIDQQQNKVTESHIEATEEIVKQLKELQQQFNLKITTKMEFPETATLDEGLYESDLFRSLSFKVTLQDSIISQLINEINCLKSQIE